jgi:tetratricopeptide (TPR) repeat protein
MADLLDALSRGHTRARAWAWLAGAAATTTLGASLLAYQQYDRSTRIAACEDAGASIAVVWNDEARARVRGGLVATGLSSASVTADKVMPFLDAYAAAWREQRTHVCLQADLAGTLDAELLDRAVWCLDERRMDLAALADGLARADATAAQRAVIAAAGLPPASICTDEQVLAAQPSLPTESLPKIAAARATLSQVRTMLAVGNYAEGLRVTRAALGGIEALGWSPLTAAVRQNEGRLLEKTGAYAESEAVSVAAYMDAAKVRAWGPAANAAIALIMIVGHFQARPAEGKVWAGHAEVAIQFAGDPLGLLEAHRLDGLAVVHKQSGAYDEAKELQARALSIRERALGPDHVYVAASLNNLANVHLEMGAYAEARALYERALAIWERTLGPDHPDVAMALNNIAIVDESTGEYAEARALHERALAIRERTLGPAHPYVADSLNNLATVLRDTGAYGESRALLERAAAIWEKALGPDHPDVALSVNNLADVHAAMGEYAEARALYERALAIRERAEGPDHPDVADSLTGLGSLELTRGQPAAARPLLERAVAIFAGHEGVQAAEPMARFNLARALVASDGDRARALAEARAALDELRGAGNPKESARVEAFLAELADGPASGGP